MRLMVISLFVSTLMVTGCAIVDAGKQITKGTLDAFEPNHRDPGDDISLPDENWDQYGVDARADRPTEKQNDPINKSMLSPKAIAIERSLGYEYE